MEVHCYLNPCGMWNGVEYIRRSVNDIQPEWLNTASKHDLLLLISHWFPRIMLSNRNVLATYAIWIF